MAWKLKDYDDGGMEFRAFIAEDGGVWIFTIQSRHGYSGVLSTYHKQAVDLMRSVPKYHLIHADVDFDKLMNIDILQENKKGWDIGVIVDNMGHECKYRRDEHNVIMDGEGRKVIFWDENVKNVFYQFLRHANC